MSENTDHETLSSQPKYIDIQDMYIVHSDILNVQDVKLLCPTPSTKSHDLCNNIHDIAIIHIYDVIYCIMCL